MDSYAGILRILRERDDFVSGQELCDTLGVSRTAVWKMMKNLEEEGYELEAVTKKGYRLLSSPDKVTEKEIESRLDTEWAAKNLVCFEETGSTNTQAKRLGDEGAAHGTLVVSECQTGGKGRRGRTWLSSPGQGIWMSILLRPQIPAEKISGITLAAALSVCRAIKDVTGLEAQIKWPNDIVINKKKIVGILTEISAETDFIHYIVIGIGINCHQESFPEDLPYAGSIKLALGKGISRAQLIAKVWKYFEKDYEKYIRNGDLTELKTEYESFLANKGGKVRILAPAGDWEGTCLGIDETGSLLVRNEEGETVKVNSGEVSVRGLYGYV